MYSTLRYLKDYFRLNKSGVLVNGEIVQTSLEIGYGMHIPIMKYIFDSKRYQNKVIFTYLTILPRRIGKKYEILIDPEKPTLCLFYSKMVIYVLIFNQMLFLIGAILFLICV